MHIAITISLFQTSYSEQYDLSYEENISLNVIQCIKIAILY